MLHWDFSLLYAMTLLDLLKSRLVPLNPRKSTTRQQQIGDAAEDQALRYLQAQGLILLQRQFRCRGGEIDLIMRDQQTLVFIEVRSRKTSDYGGALQSITPAKQKRWHHAASVYLQRYAQMPECRFDVICVQKGELQWLKQLEITAT